MPKTKKLSYRILTFIFSLIISLSFVIPVYAESSYNFYNDVLIETTTPFGMSTNFDKKYNRYQCNLAGMDSEDRERFSISEKEKNYLDQYVDQVYSQIQENRKAGKTQFRVSISFPTRNLFLTNRSVFDLPPTIIHSVVRKDAYLRSNSIISNVVSNSHKNQAPYEISFDITFDTTLDQEKYVDQQLPKIVKNLKLSGKSDKEKLKIIYDYVRKNVIYDDSIEANSLQNTAYGALKDKHSLCNGMAALFYRLARQAGISSVNLEFGYIGKKTFHVWCTYKGKIIDCAHSSAHDGFLYYTPRDQFLINGYPRQYIPFVSDNGLNFALDGMSIYNCYKKACESENVSPNPLEWQYQYYNKIVNSDDITAGFETEFGS